MRPTQNVTVKPQNPALPAGLQDMLGDSGELPPNLGGGLSGLLH